MPEYQTVKVRPITFAEIEALAGHDVEPVQVYLAEDSLQHGRVFSPATLTLAPRMGKKYHDAPVPYPEVFDMVEDTRPNSNQRWKNNPDVIVGYVVAGRLTTIFGTQTDVHLFTSPEAERSSQLVNGWSDPSAGRCKVFVEDPKAGHEERLMPIYGAQVSCGFILTGIDAEEARERAEAALRAEFGDALRPNFKMHSRPVRDRRVNVYTVVDREPLALNILDSEVSYHMHSGSAHVEEVDPAARQVTVGT